MKTVLDLVTAPVYEPLELDGAKEHLRVDSTADDVLIPRLIEAARNQVENYLHRALITQTWKIRASGFPALDSTPIELPKPPLQSVTSIQYVDGNGDTQTWADTNYSVSAPTGEQAEPGFILPNYSVSYPATREQWDAVTITFVAGYGDDANDMPEAIRVGLSMVLGDIYENREATIVGTIAQDLKIAQRVMSGYRAQL